MLKTDKSVKISEGKIKMRKVGFSARALLVTLLSFLMSLCLIWAFKPLFSSAENSEEQTPAQAVAQIVEGYSNRLVDDNLVDGEIMPIVLSGTREEIAAGWNSAYALSTGDKYVYLRLDSDWIAEEPEGSGTPIFGIGAGFVAEKDENNTNPVGYASGVGAILVTTNKIILDLNGHVISRDLNNEKYAGKNYFGSVMFINSSVSDVIFVDSNPTADHEDAYTYLEVSQTIVKTDWSSYVSTSTETRTVTGGIITGGRATSTGSIYSTPVYGGGIRMWAGTLNLLGGTIFGNEASLHGAGVYLGSNGTVNVNGGNIIANKGLSVLATSSYGGGICAIGPTSHVNVISGKISANEANSGAGIHSAGIVEISGGEVSHNIASNQGGGIYASGDKSVLTVAGEGLVSHNRSVQGGAVYTSVGSAVEVAGGVITYNASGTGGAMFLNCDLTLSGGTVTKNLSSSYSGSNSGIYFYASYNLFLAGPVQLYSNGTEDYVSNDISGSCTVSVTGDLARGEGADKEAANIHISQSYAPIKGYGENNNKDEANQTIEPDKYFFFNYIENDRGYAILTDAGVIYYTPFSAYYYQSTDGRNYDVKVESIGADGNYGITFNYGDYGKFGLRVAVAGDGVEEADADEIYFYHYYYEEGKETADSGELTSYSGSYTIDTAGIYIGTTYLSYDVTVELRVIVRPRSLNANNVTVDCDTADKTFEGKEICPEVSSVSIEEWFENINAATESENQRYDPRNSGYVVEYENNIHVAGKTYIVVKGVGNYGGEKKIEFKILQPQNAHYEIEGWQYYDGAEWKAFPENLTPFSYNDTSRKYSVRALLKTMKNDADEAFTFEDGKTYSAYAYVADCSQTDQKKSDALHTDPGLILNLGGESDIFNAKTYNLTVECLDGELGNFALPQTALETELILSPYNITKAELSAAAAETDTSLLAVDEDGEYFPFISSVTYVADNVVAEGTDKFGYVLYNGKEYAVLLNPDFKINIDMLGSSFISYVTDVSYSHSVGGSAVTVINGRINKVVNVTTAITFTMNSNFSVEGGNTATITKEWKIVTKSNAIAFGEMENTFAYGTEGALALPEQEIANNVTFITVNKAGVQVASVAVDGRGNLFGYSETAQNHLGDAIEGTLRAYLDGVLLANGVGAYSVTASALDFVSAQAEENGAIYYAAPATVTFTVTARSITAGNGVTVEIDSDNLVYNGDEIEAAVILTFGNKTLVKGVDYETAYENNIHAGNNAKVTITGKGNFSGSLENTFTISPATNNTWIVSLNIASWVTNSFNANISFVKGEPLYGADTLSFGIIPSEDLNISNEIKDKLKTIEIDENGVIASEYADILRGFPVGTYKLVATQSVSTDYNAISGEYEFYVFSAEYTAPTFNYIEEGALQNSTYTGNNLSMNIRHFDSAVMRVETSSGLVFDANGGTVYATNAGTYTVRISLVSEECTWADGSREPLTLSWTIARRVIKAPDPVSDRFIVNGTVQTYIPEGYDPTYMRIENNEKTDAGTYRVTVYLLDPDNYEWDDGTNGARVFSWQIESAYLLFVIISTVIGILALVALLFAIGQYIKHRARMRDLAEADAEPVPEDSTSNASDDVNEGGNV